MMESGSSQLLRQFVETRSDEAFRHLVRTHAPMVLSTALRRLAGDRAAAEDVTQEVFTLLARKAGSLGGVVLAGWLYRQTCRRASNFVRTETRRKQRETTAMEQSSLSHHPESPDDLTRELDAAMEALPAKDRDALVIRYFESADYSTVGRALGISEEAARKQVSRALEKLSAIFKRKGIAVASVSLGGTLTGFGAVPVPDGLVSQICTHAMKATPAAAGSAWMYLLKPILAGVAATSLVSAVANVRSKTDAKLHSESTGPVQTRSSRKEASKTAEDFSLEGIIAEIKRIHSGPANALTALRLNVALERVSNDHIAAFIRMANDKLTPQERAATYERLLDRWLEADPEAAMTFTLQENVGKQVDPHSGTNLLVNLFSDWLRKDAVASGAWLLKHWQNPVLEDSAFRGSLRSHLSRSVVDQLIYSDDKQPLRDFLRSLPSDMDRKEAFDSMTGETPWGSLNRFQNVRSGMDAYQFIQKLPDSPWKLETARKYLSKWMETDPQVFEQAAASAGSDERFMFALGRLGARHVPGERVPILSGGIAVHSQPNDVKIRENQAMQAGLEAGLQPSEVLGAIALVLLGRLGDDEMCQWIDAHRSQIHIDPQLAEKAADEAYSGVMIDNVPSEIAAIRWAQRISDPDLRVSLCRSLFRKLSSEKPEDAARWIDKPDMPQDLIGSFHSIMNQSR